MDKFCSVTNCDDADVEAERELSRQIFNEYMISKSQYLKKKYEWEQFAKARKFEHPPLFDCFENMGGIDS